MEHIQKEAKQLAKQYQYPILITLLYIGLYISFRDLFAQFLSAFGLIIYVLTVSIEHGKVTLGLNIITNESFDPQTEAKKGIQDMKRLFTTYLFSQAVIILFFIILFGVTLLIVKPYLTTSLALLESDLQYGIYQTMTQLVNGLSFLISLCLLGATLVHDLFFFSAPYIAQTKNIYGLKALKEAYHLQQPHLLECMKMFGHYFLYIVTFLCVEYLINHFITAILLQSLLSLICILASILVYEGEYVVAKAIMFRELLRG